MTIIKTPDQRVRVFISSTINELADERMAARNAIENLRLIPVFFEAGARPHPPRDLYSAYLEQSHIFLGIYWNSYGWVAPGAEISGLEDEYRLCANKKPKLIYVKNSEDRQEQLNQLLNDIEVSDTACYQKFNTADELQKLIENDLSVLMSEIFENALITKETIGKSQQEINAIPENALKIILPVVRSEMIGREEDLKNTLNLMLQKKTSLLNILGAGGTGKTTLSIHLAHALTSNFQDGVFFIPLAPVTDSDLVASTIADVLELQDSGNQSMEKTLVDFIKDKNMLLVMDNFEQVVDASKVISEILAHCPSVQIIITSRSSLHIRGEYVYHLLPLSIPGEMQLMDDAQFNTNPAIELFITRAKAANNQLQLTDDNKTAIATICNKLDGLPLAIELAASRTKLFQPAALVKRMDKLLELTSKGQKDLPQRQQTLRNTIEWSYNLLDPDTKKVFCILGIFKRNWTLEAADSIIANTTSEFLDIEDATEKLLDVSLIKPVLVSQSEEPRFNMLQTVFEFAGEKLKQSEDYSKTSISFANYFLDLLEQTKGILYSFYSEPWLDKIEYEYQNIRSAFYILIDLKNHEKAWHLFELMIPYWIIRGGYTDVNLWIEAAGIEKYDDAEIQSAVSTQQKAVTQTWAGLAILMLLQIERGYNLLYEAEKNATECGDMHTLALAITLDGCYGYFMNIPDAVEKIKQAKELIDQYDDPFMECMFYMWSYEYYRVEVSLDIVFDNLEKARKLADENDLLYIHATLYIIIMNLDLLTEPVNISKILDDSLRTNAMFPAKGYTGMKSATTSGAALCYMYLNQFVEAEKYLMKALYYTRISGEKESEFFNAMAAAQFYSLTGDKKKGAVLMGAIDGFIELVQYPMVGASLKQYEMTVEIVLGDRSDLQLLEAYKQGKRIALEDAIILAMKK